MKIWTTTTTMTTTTLLFSVLTSHDAYGFSVGPQLSTTATTTAQRSLQWQPQSQLLLPPQSSETLLCMSSTDESATPTQPEPLSQISSNMVKLGMMLFVASMCVALPLTLLPQQLLVPLGLKTPTEAEKMALETGQFCARTLHQLIPFCSIETITDGCDNTKNHEYEPAVWVCNHTSMLDVFILLAADLRLRGPNKRPIKVVYWKQLEDNPVSKLLFQQCGFIPIQMADNGNGQENEYDVSSFKAFLRQSKKALADGFDIGILPEGQLNPAPEDGMLPVYRGAYTLARMSRRPIQMLALHGVHRLWHPIHGMTPTDNHIKVRMYPQPTQTFASGEEFDKTFTTVVGHFGQYGTDIDNLDDWLNGKAYQQALLLQEEEATAATAN